MAKNTPAKSTTDLLADLNAANSAAVAERTVPATASAVKLPAGATKIAIFLPPQITYSRNRADGYRAPVWLVYVIEGGRVERTHYVHSIHGAADTVVNLGGKVPGCLPNRLPDTAGTDPSHFLPTRLDWWLQSDAELTVFMEPREVAPVSVAQGEDKPAQPEQSASYSELPPIPRAEFATPGIGAFLDASEEAIAAGYADRKYGRAVAAAHALVAVIQCLSIVDGMPPAPPRRPGDQFINGQEDPYPTGSAVLRAANDTALASPELSAGYGAALRLLASRCMALTSRNACEQAAESLIELRRRMQALHS
jgi:hypothetical protein